MLLITYRQCILFYYIFDLMNPIFYIENYFYLVWLVVVKFATFHTIHSAWRLIYIYMYNRITILSWITLLYGFGKELDMFRRMNVW